MEEKSRAWKREKSELKKIVDTARENEKKVKAEKIEWLKRSMEVWKR